MMGRGATGRLYRRRMSAMPPLSPEDRAALQQEWLALTRHDLPALATARGWPIALDHCFARVLLDNAVGGCWYDSIPRRPAYRHATDTQLAAAVRLARAARDGSLDLHAANARSLAWRRARGGPRPDPGGDRTGSLI